MISDFSRIATNETLKTLTGSGKAFQKECDQRGIARQDSN